MSDGQLIDKRVVFETIHVERAEQPEQFEAIIKRDYESNKEVEQH